ncbi:MAG TPA: ABC transporter permease [Bryobacteraceae bacterium]|jgi:predicted permease|nr:ABC transporter permease [Bryobacteraceae bacterium]
MNWLARLCQHNKLEHDLGKELQFHIAERISALKNTGLSEEEARRRVRQEFGGIEQVREECRDARGTRWLEDFWQDLRYTLRTLRQRPGFAAITLATLALGSGATTVMFTVIDSVLLKPLSYPESGRLFTLREHTQAYGDRWFAYLNFLDCRRESRSMDIAAWKYDGGGMLTNPGEPEYVSGLQISSNLFSVLRVSLLQGRAFLPEEDRPGGAPVAIISYSLWRQRFGGNSPGINRQIVLDGKPYTVVGVAPLGFQLSGEQAEVLTPLGQNTEARMQNREARFIHVIARLRHGVALGQAQAELTFIGEHLAAEYPKSNAGHNFIARPLRQELVGDVRSTLWLLFGAVGVVLVIACVNVASLLLVRAVSRERELAMRAALGAGRIRLIRQCLTESALLGIAGGTLGILLAALGIRPFVVLWPDGLPRAEDVRFDWRVLLFALAVSIFCGVLFGLAPALRVPANRLEQTLRAGARTLTGSSRLHSGFVASQIALAVVLLVSAGMLGRTLLRLSSLNPGVDVHNVLVARVALPPSALASPAQARAAWKQLPEHARRTPGVQSAALADTIPMREGLNELGYWTTPARPPLSQMPLALASGVTPDYSRVMGLRLLQGRFFNDHDRLGSEPVIVIDALLAQHAFGSQNPVGKRIWIQAIGPARIVGVVGHVRHWGLAGDDQALVRDQFYYPFAQVPDSLMRFFSTILSLTVRTNIPPLNVVEPLSREISSNSDPAVLYEIRTMEQLARGSLARQRFLLVLFSAFAGLALLLASIGIYGVLSYLMGQRISEIGVRIALGASRRNVMQLVFRQSLRMLACGVSAGVCVAFACSRILEHAIAGMLPADPLTFVTMISVLIAAALFASFIPARRASRVDPMTALRAG